MNVGIRAAAASMFAMAILGASPEPGAQSSPPEKSRGVSRAELAVIKLGDEIDGMAGRMLQQHRTSIEPGGVIALHDHVDHPQILFVFAGKLTDHQGDQAQEYIAGQAFAVGRRTRHWLENRGTEPAVFIATTILKESK